MIEGGMVVFEKAELCHNVNDARDVRSLAPVRWPRGPLERVVLF